MSQNEGGGREGKRGEGEGEKGRGSGMGARDVFLWVPAPADAKV